MSDAIPFLAYLAARRDTTALPQDGFSRSTAAAAIQHDAPWAPLPPDHDGDEGPATGSPVAAKPSVEARLPLGAPGITTCLRIDPDGWLAALLHGLGILAVLFLLSGAVLIVFGEI